MLHPLWTRRRWLVWIIGSLLAVWVGGCSSHPNPEPVTAEMGLTIRLVNAQDPVPKSQKVYRSHGEDHVRWSNETSTDRTITFQPNIWPFEEDEVVIKVPANSKSWWYTIGPSLQLRQDTYTINPPMGGPPGEPDVTGGD
jgi:hypothetical protein